MLYPAGAAVRAESEAERRAGHDVSRGVGSPGVYQEGHDKGGRVWGVGANESRQGPFRVTVSFRFAL